MTQAQVNQGDEKYSSFLRHYLQARRTIFTYVYMFVGNASDADDVFQDVCVVMWNKFDQFQPGSNFLAWAKQITRNLVMDYRKHHRRHRVRGLDDKMVDMLAFRYEHIQDQVGDRIDALKHCVEKLSFRDRDLVRRAYERNESVKDIAKECHVSLQRIYKRLGTVHGALLRCVRLALQGTEVRS